MAGPKKIIELDSEPGPTWRLEPGAMHLWRGRLWQLETVGCVVCVENDSFRTLSRPDDDEQRPEHFWCEVHGELVEVPYVMVKEYTITIGGVMRTGEQRIEDSMLFPAAMSADERDRLIAQLLDEAEKSEQEDGVAPPDDDY